MSIESINPIMPIRPIAEYLLNPIAFLSISQYDVGSVVDVLGKNRNILFSYLFTCELNNANNRLYLHFAGAEYRSRSSVMRLLSLLGFPSQTAFVRAVFFNVTYTGQKVTSTVFITSFVDYSNFITYSVPS